MNCALHLCLWPSMNIMKLLHMAFGVWEITGLILHMFLFHLCIKCMGKKKNGKDNKRKGWIPMGNCHGPFPSQHASGWFQYSIKSREETAGDRPEHQGRWKNRWKHQQAHLQRTPELLDLLLAACSLHTREQVHTKICGRRGVGTPLRTFSCLQYVSARPGWCRVSGSRRRHIPVGLHRAPIWVGFSPLIWSNSKSSPQWVIWVPTNATFLHYFVLNK